MWVGDFVFNLWFPPAEIKREPDLSFWVVCSTGSALILPQITWLQEKLLLFIHYCDLSVLPGGLRERWGQNLPAGPAATG